MGSPVDILHPHQHVLLAGLCLALDAGLERFLVDADLPEPGSPTVTRRPRRPKVA
jgi:hypothetical protein